MLGNGSDAKRHVMTVTVTSGKGGVGKTNAIELTKKFGTDESGAFVNGILDSVARASGKADAKDLR